MIIFLILLSAAGLLGTLGFTVLFALGRADHLLLRLLGCLIVLDHGSLLLLHLLARTRVSVLLPLLRVTGPLVVVVGLAAVVESVRSGTSLLAPYETWFGAVLIALGGLSVVYLGREAPGDAAKPEGIAS
jgi:hypothetical protein